MGCNPSYRFSIDGHNLTIIETDGIATDPLTVNQLEIFPGQRYSVVVDANQNTDNYWIRAAAVNFDGTLLPANLTGFAILRYDGANATEPTTQPPKSYNVMNEADLHVCAFFTPGHWTSFDARFLIYSPLSIPVQ